MGKTYANDGYFSGEELNNGRSLNAYNKQKNPTETRPQPRTQFPKNIAQIFFREPESTKHEISLNLAQIFLGQQKLQPKTTQSLTSQDIVDIAPQMFWLVGEIESLHKNCTAEKKQDLIDKIITDFHKVAKSRSITLSQNKELKTILDAFINDSFEQILNASNNEENIESLNYKTAKSIQKEMVKEVADHVKENCPEILFLCQIEAFKELPVDDFKESDKRIFEFLLEKIKDLTTCEELMIPQEITYQLISDEQASYYQLCAIEPNKNHDADLFFNKKIEEFDNFYESLPQNVKDSIQNLRGSSSNSYASSEIYDSEVSYEEPRHEWGLDNKSKSSSSTCSEPTSRNSFNQSQKDEGKNLETTPNTSIKNSSSSGSLPSQQNSSQSPHTPR